MYIHQSMKNCDKNCNFKIGQIIQFILTEKFKRETYSVRPNTKQSCNTDNVKVKYSTWGFGDCLYIYISIMYGNVFSILPRVGSRIKVRGGGTKKKCRRAQRDAKIWGYFV